MFKQLTAFQLGSRIPALALRNITIVPILLVFHLAFFTGHKAIFHVTLAG